MVKSKHPDPNNPTPPSPQEPQKAAEMSPGSDSQSQCLQDWSRQEGGAEQAQAVG